MSTAGDKQAGWMLTQESSLYVCMRLYMGAVDLENENLCYSNPPPTLYVGKMPTDKSI